MSKSKFACEAIKAAQACRSNAEERFRRNGNGRLTQGDPGYVQQITRQGQTPKRASAAPSHRSNAPIRKESQSILSKIVAHSASYLIPSPESMPDTSRYSGPSANIPSHSHSTSIFLSI